MYSKHLPKRFINEIRAYIHTHKYDYDHDQLREDYGCIFTGLHQELFNKDYYSNPLCFPSNHFQCLCIFNGLLALIFLSPKFTFLMFPV